MPRKVKSRWTRSTPPTVGFDLDREEHRDQRERRRLLYLASLRRIAGTIRELRGRVERIEKYGVFVSGDWGKGLVHISRMANSFVADAHDVVILGKAVTVWVFAVDEQDRVDLTMIPPAGATTLPANSSPQIQAPFVETLVERSPSASVALLPPGVRDAKCPMRSFSELASFVGCIKINAESNSDEPKTEMAVKQPTIQREAEPTDDSPAGVAKRLSRYVDELLIARKNRNAIAIQARTQMIHLVLDKLRKAYSVQPLSPDLVHQIKRDQKRAQLDPPANTN